MLKVKHSCVAVLSLVLGASAVRAQTCDQVVDGIATFPPGTDSISSWAFFGCEELTEIVIPNTVTEIGSDAFNDAENLRKVTFEAPSQVDSIGKGAFANTDIKAIILPPRLTTLGVFSPGIDSIFLPRSITSITDDLTDAYYADTFFAGTCFDKLPALETFFESEVKTTDFIICECVQVAEISLCPALNALAPTISKQSALASSVFVETFPIGDGVGYTADPVGGSPCLDIDDIDREGGSQTIVGGTCNDRGCKDCAIDKCDEKPLDAPPYAVACPSTCKLKTSSTDKENDKCTNARDEESTYELECVNSIGFTKIDQCYTSALQVTPIVSSPGQDDKPVAPAFPPGDGVGYTDPPQVGSTCKNLLAEDYVIDGGECNGSSCECVAQLGVCDSGDTLIPHAVTCPELCELVTPSQSVDNDNCTSEETGTYFVKCIDGIFKQMEQCYVPEKTSPPTPALTPRPTARLSAKPTVAPSEPKICGNSKSEYLENMLSFLSEISDSSALSIPDTPQYLSRMWLIDSGVCSDDGTAREMYVLGVMFYGWGIGHHLHGGRAKLCGYIGIQCRKIDNGKLLHEIGADEEIDADEDVRFTKVFMRDRNLEGQIPHEIGFLTTLVAVDLSNNSLSGKIPSVLEKLQDLTHLNLAHNLLKGTLPEEIYSLTSLRLLALDRNGLSGTLSSSVGNLLDLQMLSLFSNKFYGLFPNQLGELKQLKELHLDQNMLEGQCNANLCNSVNYGKLKDFTVDCDNVSCSCATHCHASSNNQHVPVPNNPNNNWGQPQPANPNNNWGQFWQPQHSPMNPNVHPRERNPHTRRRCLCDIYTGRPCIGQRPACGNGMHQCTSQCDDGPFSRDRPCMCDVLERPCDTRRPCGVITYVCDACGLGSVRGAARCVCDNGSRLPCVPMEYPACGLNSYECNLCGY